MRALPSAVASLVLALSLGGTSAAQTSAADDFFNPAVLHRIDLLISSRDWAKLKANYQLNDYYPATLKWQGITVQNVGIRSRGLGSRAESKPGLRVDMNRYNTGQEFLGLKSFVLDNLWQDASGIREAIAMRLYARLGLPAPRETFARLYVNNTYAGVYGVVESIDKAFLARVFGEHDGDTENDGPLFEYNWTYPWFFTYPGSDLEPYKELFDPKTHETDSDWNLYHPIEQMVRTANEVSDALFATSMAEYLDLPTFMKHVAAEAFLAEWDGIVGYAGVNNLYLYRFEGKNLSQFVMWDADNTFHAVDYSILQGQQDNVLMRRAMQVDELRRAFFDAVLAAEASAAETDPEEVVESGASRRGWLEREIDATNALIQSAMHTDPAKPYSNEEFDEAVEGLRQFARLRGGFVKCEVATLIDPDHAAEACAAR